MKIIADDKIPLLSELFSAHGEVKLIPGEKITQQELRDADILLARTVTHIDEKLLSHTTVKFVGTATTGTDHVDAEWLKKHEIFFADSAGANSEAVMEYVFCCLAALKKCGILRQKKQVAGIIGCGRIGRLVAALLESLGFIVQCYDPLLTEKPPFHFTSLTELMRSSDLITLHTPLTHTGKHPTKHMINELMLASMKKEAVLINTARGSVIDKVALLAIEKPIVCLDVWENEPHISLELLNKVIIGTPHIAGYSLPAKYRATEMLYKKAAKFFGWPEKKFSIGDNMGSLKINPQSLNAESIALSIYDPIAHTHHFRESFSNAKNKNGIRDIFIEERKNYPLREGFFGGGADEST